MRSSNIRRLRVLGLLSLLIGCASPAVVDGVSAFRSATESIGLAYRGKRSWKLGTSYRRGEWSKGGVGFWTLTASADPVRLRLEAARGLSEEETDSRIKDKRAMIESLYSGSAAYPGMVTRRFEVPVELRPVKIPQGGRTIYLLHATPALSYGAGAEDLTAYRALLAFRRCPGALVQVELFFPKGSFDRRKALEELAAFDCR